MASLRDIRQRIRSVKNTQKITGAMKMVAAAKLRRAQEAIMAARPYSNELEETLGRVAARVATQSGNDNVHPLLQEHADPKRVLLVVVTSDRGLCGAFNVNILRRAQQFVRENQGKYEELHVAAIGRRGAEFFQKRNTETVRNFTGVFDELTFRRASEIAEGIAKEYTEEGLDAVYILYNEFKSAIAQEVQLKQILPLARGEHDVTEEEGEYIYEPSAEEVLNKLVPRYVATLVWRALLESFAAEHGARMAAMDNATKNAKDLVERLMLQYNRARQAAITVELMEIVGGAEALNG